MTAMEQPFSAVSLSGGKDSTAMLLMMIERGLPIDVVLFVDTGMEFPEMYQHLAKVDAYLYQKRGLHIVNLQHPKGFEWLMFDEPKKKAKIITRRKESGIAIKGNGWPGVRVRWCTGHLKMHLVNRKIGELKGQRPLLQYVGIAADESKRCKDQVYPLVDWGITEADALQFCYEKGFDFGGLYKIYNRTFPVSEDRRAAQAAEASPGIMAKVVSNGQKSAGAVWKYTAWKVSVRLDCRRTGTAVCIGGCANDDF